MAVVWPSKNNFANGDVLTATNMNNIGDTLNVFNPTSATNGQIWVANGSGSGSFQTVSAASMTSLATGTMSTTTTSITGISASYKDLILEIYGVTFGSNSAISIGVNNSTNNYIGAISSCLNGTYTTAGSTYSYANFTDSSTIRNAGGNNYCRVFIPNYNNVTNRCQLFVTSAAEYGLVTYGSYQAIYNKRDVTAPISSVQIVTGATPTAGTYRLWGVN